MEYPKEIENFLKKKKIEVGDLIEIRKKDGKILKGILMPRIELGNKNSLIIKLENGYNLGIDWEEILEIEKIEKIWKLKKEKEVKEDKIEFRKDFKWISILSTGGTIASKIDYRSGGVYASFSAKEIVQQIPDLKEIANLKVKQIMQKMSEDMLPEDWKIIAKEVAKEINDGKEGVIVTHGTDTLHFTSAALSFMLQNLTKPVALVGSQRSSDRGSSDAVMNVSCAANFLVNSDVAEVLVIMHGSINDDYCFAIRGTKVRKMHTSRRDAFRPINDLPIAKIYWKTKKIEILNENYRKKREGKVKVDDKLEEKIALIKVYPGFEPKIFDFYIKEGYKGFVIEGTGLGHVPTFSKKSIIPKIENAINSGIPIVITSQCLYGKTHPTIYHNLRELYKRGVIFVEDMLPEVAYVKLMWVLGHTKKMEKIKELMQKNIAGEISEKLKLETFLY